MHLIKIGSQYINVENVVSFEDYLEWKPSPMNKIGFEFIGRSHPEFGYGVVEGKDADALRVFLKERAHDLNKDLERREASRA